MNVEIQWSEIRSAVKAINFNGLEQDEYIPDVILPISRGGLVPAVMLSHIMRKQPKLDVLQVDKTHKRLGSYHVWRSDIKYLVIDDIFDTGETHEIVEQALRPHFIEVKYAYLFARRMSLLEDYNFYIANIVTHSHWLHFPWESK